MTAQLSMCGVSVISSSPLIGGFPSAFTSIDVWFLSDPHYSPYSLFLYLRYILSQRILTKCAKNKVLLSGMSLTRVFDPCCLGAVKF